MKRRSRSDERGISLIETMIGMLVLVTALLSLAQLMGVALQQNALARSTSIGSQVAMGKIDELNSVFNRQLETKEDEDALAAGRHGPELVYVRAPQNSGLSDRVFRVRWDIVDDGPQKTVTVLVDPYSADRTAAKTVTVTSHFSP